MGLYTERVETAPLLELAAMLATLDFRPVSTVLEALAPAPEMMK